VTHDQTEARTLGQRVTVMNRGVVQQVDAPQELYDWPSNTFVASFIGSPPMNFVRGSLESGQLRLTAAELTLPEDALARVDAEGRELTVGLRPESFVPAGEGALSQTVRGQVEVVERLGSESFVYFRAEGLDVIEIGERPMELQGTLCARLAPGIRYEPGDVMELEIRAEQVRLFSPETGAAVLAPPGDRGGASRRQTAARA
jgi:multiple sugar transport system ATP-binding protein